MNTKYSIKNYLDFLHRRKEKLENTPVEHCVKCGGTGESEIYISLLKRNIVGACDCVSNEELESIKEKIIKTENMLVKYHDAFGTLDDDFDFEKYKNTYKENTKVIEFLEKYLTHSMDNLLLLTGESGTGKTIVLKMIWQIFMLNKKSVYYLNCPDFEKMYHQEYSINGISEKIESVIGSIKQSEYVLIDDHIFQPHKNMLGGYYKIFDNARAFGQKVIIASNKNFDEIIKSYESKDETMATRLQTRLENLNLIECEVFRNEEN